MFNQIVFTPGDRDITLKLINVYFEMFKEILGEVDVGSANDDALGDEVGKEKDDRGENLKDKRGRVIDLGGKKGKGKEREVTSAAGFAKVEDSNVRLVSDILTGVNQYFVIIYVCADDHFCRQSHRL